MNRIAVATALGALAAAVALLPADGEAAAARRSRRAVPARVTLVAAPLGTAGLAGSGQNIVIPFRLVDSRRAPTDVEAEYGIDWNGDGQIADDEYRPASEDRRDARDTRRNRKPLLFVTGTDIGAAHAFVWRCTADLGTGRHVQLDYRRTDQGRLLPDATHPGEFLFDPAAQGVRFRIRAVRRLGSRRIVGDWATCDPFDVDNDRAPSVTVDGVVPDAGGTVDVSWTAFDADSEDLDGDGRFDADEDLNHDGVFEQEQVGVAFDYHSVQPGEDPASMTPAELDELYWQPCTRAAGLGDTDSFRAPANQAVHGSPAGRTWTFVWDKSSDERTFPGPFILRARAIDARQKASDAAYVTEPFTVAD